MLALALLLFSWPARELPTPLRRWLDEVGPEVARELAGLSPLAVDLIPVPTRDLGGGGGGAAALDGLLADVNVLDGIHPLGGVPVGNEEDMLELVLDSAARRDDVTV